MLSYVYQGLQLKTYKKIESESFEYIQDLFSAILTIGITSQLKHGLSREYIEKSDNLSTLRGKINIVESIMLRINDDFRLSCWFDELSENNLMNRILKTTMLLLINDGNVKHENKVTLKKIIPFFSEISILQSSAINWQRLSYNRNNATYLMLMNICYMVLHELLHTTEKGEQKLASFLDDQKMSRLYEKFILEFYKKHFPQFQPAAREIRWNTIGTTDFLPRMQSDTMLTDNNNGKKLIIDAKYHKKIFQTQYEIDTVKSNNLYQIFSYVKNEDKSNTGLVDGMLLYAKTDDTKIQNIEYNFGGNRININTLDLNNDFLNIKTQLFSIVDQWQR